MIKLEGLFGIVVFALWVFCLVDAIGAPADRIRNLPKVGWILLILFFPLIGSVAWLVAGRPDNAGARRSAYERQQPGFPEYDRPGRAAAVDPEKDAEFLRGVRERAEAQRKAYDEQKKREREADGTSD
ncbi:hypothetical protein ASC77_15210 [Nocardioides sp. Root1257]|uniref:PLD nuclease N-terminal domain-containing protein n=1 Tax=unclassified Nocardioides TaxID=2615069 RepID=UPI00070142A8|nr:MULTISPECIES: PLD nuclease N-terminal domain-containing protein [unclassified Nocardioides]KQW47773.1 hypothetical protein ASC77_15210 [Nocardioides sp. Root1257]KRC45025.1 hypothetical protein ASE24_16160 [Nocardioides sp. Root224]